jgi:hypothetical protein
MNHDDVGFFGAPFVGGLRDLLRCSMEHLLRMGKWIDIAIGHGISGINIPAKMVRLANSLSQE